MIPIFAANQSKLFIHQLDILEFNKAQTKQTPEAKGVKGQDTILELKVSEMKKFSLVSLVSHFL